MQLEGPTGSRQNAAMTKEVMVRRLKPEDVQRIREIDRTETVRVGYRMDQGVLIRMDVVWNSSPWREDGSEHSFQQMIEFLERVLKDDGTLLGAFDGNRLVGLAAFRPRLTETTGQLAFLHVSNGYRRHGIATQLIAGIIEMAKESGARELYVSATPSQSAVGFYLSHGFRPTRDPHPQLLEEEPDDIHMTMRL
jgi:N-acetylglutamate synthase-like GNAT family acetyltransferase